MQSSPSDDDYLKATSRYNYEDFCHQQLTSYKVYALQKAEPIKEGDLLDIKKDQETRRNTKRDKDNERSKRSITLQLL
jgi:hypothetical protein